MMRVLSVALALLAAPACADPDRLSVLLGSRHIGSGGFNEVNPGLFLTWENRGLGLDYSVGAYVNSYDRPSVAATVALPFASWRDGQAAVFGGVAYYRQDGRNFAVHAGDFVPLAGVQVRHRNAFFQIVPMDGKPVDALITFGVTFSLSPVPKQGQRQ